MSALATALLSLTAARAISAVPAQKFKFRSPTVVSAGVPSQAVLCHLADLWLRLGSQLQTTMRDIERTCTATGSVWSFGASGTTHGALCERRVWTASPAKQCLTALKHSVDGSLPHGSNSYEQSAAVAYAYLYFRAKWVRTEGRGAMFETVRLPAFTTAPSFAARVTMMRHTHIHRI